MKLRMKLIASFSIPFVIMLSITVIVLSLMMGSTIGGLIQEEGVNASSLIRDLATESYELNQQRAIASGSVVHHTVNQQVSLLVDSPTTITAINQISGERSQISIPTMTYLGIPFAEDHSFVDTMTQLMGGTFTIFQTIPQGLLRISTSVFNTAGERAVGTYIPRDSVVYQTVSRGEIFYGRAFVVDAWYITMYAPLLDDQGDFVGVVYSGVKEANLDSLREKIFEIHLQESGFVSIFNGDGELIIDPYREGTNIANTPYYETIMAEGTGQVNFQYRDKEWVGYFDVVTEMDWHILTQIPLEEVNAPLAGLILVLLLTMLFLLLITISVSLLVANSLVKPIDAVVRIAQKVSQGDLSTNINIQRKDEIGQLASSMSSMLESLKEKGEVLKSMAEKDFTMEITMASQKDGLAQSMIGMSTAMRQILGSVQIASRQVVTGSDQVSMASQALSQGATESAASLEEISSSINQINGQAKQNALSANEASKLAEKTLESSQEGNHKMEELQGAMATISSSAKEIGKVIKAIEDIAFQINLLALNANVEAARAGKYGRGFSVVAEEVRTLAVRSSKAVQETTEIITTSLQNIESGNELTNETASSLSNITSFAKNVAHLLQEITTASDEQSLAITGVTKGLDQVDQVTQANTASAEESASAAQELAGQAKMLLQEVQTFRLQEEANHDGKYLLSHVDN